MVAYIHHPVGFIRSLLEVAASDACPYHLRQLSLVLIIQQVRRQGRYAEMEAAIHTMLLEYSFAIMASSENNLKNSGVSFICIHCFHLLQTINCMNLRHITFGVAL